MGKFGDGVACRSWGVAVVVEAEVGWHCERFSGWEETAFEIEAEGRGEEGGEVGVVA